MKKIISVMIALVLVISLCACGNTKTSSNASENKDQNSITSDSQKDNGNNTSNNGDSTSKNDKIEDSENSSGKDETEEMGKPVNSTKPSDKGKPIDDNKNFGNNNSGGNNSNKNDPNSNYSDDKNSSSHTHSFSAATCTDAKKCSCGATEGKALGHKWSEATCKTPKTCSVCKITDGKMAEHSLNTAGLCKWCNQPIVVAPSKLKNRVYGHYYLTTFTDEPYYINAPSLYGYVFDFRSNSFSNIGWNIEGDYLRNELNYNPDPTYAIFYNGKDYYADTGGYGDIIQKQINGNSIVVSDGSGKFLVEFELLSNDTLRVISKGNRDINVGDILS